MELFYLCIKIFFVRIIDVSLGTIRTVLTVKDKILLSSIIGFFEVLVWFIIVRDALNTPYDSILIAFSYSLGFSIGTYVGGMISKFLTNKGTLSVQIIIDSNKKEIIDILHKEGYALSFLNASGYHSSDKLLLFVEIDSFRYRHFKNIITTYDDSIFMVINNSKEVYNGYFASNVK